MRLSSTSNWVVRNQAQLCNHGSTWAAQSCCSYGEVCETGHLSECPAGQWSSLLGSMRQPSRGDWNSTFTVDLLSIVKHSSNSVRYKHSRPLLSRPTLNPKSQPLSNTFFFDSYSSLHLALPPSVPFTVFLLFNLPHFFSIPRLPHFLKKTLPSEELTEKQTEKLQTQKERDILQTQLSM